LKSKGPIHQGDDFVANVFFVMLAFKHQIARLDICLWVMKAVLAQGASQFGHRHFSVAANVNAPKQNNPNLQ
jgi:hypothetical protein